MLGPHMGVDRIMDLEWKFMDNPSPMKILWGIRCPRIFGAARPGCQRWEAWSIFGGTGQKRISDIILLDRTTSKIFWMIPYHGYSLGQNAAGHPPARAWSGFGGGYLRGKSIFFGACRDIMEHQQLVEEVQLDYMVLGHSKNSVLTCVRAGWMNGWPGLAVGEIQNDRKNSKI